LEPQFVQKDLVVTGKVIEVREPVRYAWSLPGQEKDTIELMRRFRIEVAEVFKDAGGTVKMPHGDGQKPTIEVLAKAPPGPGLLKPGPWFVNLDKGTTYVLFLQATREKGVFFLPGDMAMSTCQPVNDELVAKVRKIADVPKWPWGPEQNGLQFALLGPDGPQKLERIARGANVVFGFLVAVRNTSADPITLQLDSAKKPLKLEGRGPKDQLVTHDIFQDMSRPAGPTLTVGPGQIVLLRPTGAGGRIPSFPSISAGRWTFQLTCSAEAPHDAAPKQAWHGSVQSAPVEVEVEN
jgi:hypothetical protein